MALRGCGGLSGRDGSVRVEVVLRLVPRWRERRARQRGGRERGGREAIVTRRFERIERLDSEKKDLAEQQKEVMAEAKGRGYDTKVMRKLITLRKRDRDEIAEEEQVLYCTWCSREAKMATARTHLGELNQAIFSRVSAASGDFLE